MSKVSAAKAREQFSEMINRAAYGKETIIITRGGKDAAALVPAEAVKLLLELEEQLDVAEARRILKESKKKGTTPWKKIKAELKLEK